MEKRGKCKLKKNLWLIFYDEFFIVGDDRPQVDIHSHQPSNGE